MVTKRISIFGAIGLAATLITGGVVAFGFSSSAPSSQGKIVNLDASWANLYQSVTDLKSHSDVAVSGHFAKILDQTSDETGIPYTDFGFVVETVLFDPGKKVEGVGGILRVHQTGGVVANVTKQIGDDPLFKVDERAALFLREYKPGFFMVIGGPSGRFQVSRSGEITPMNPSGVKFVGSLDSFASLVKRS